MGVADIGEPHFFVEAERIPLCDQLCRAVIVQYGFDKPTPYSSLPMFRCDLQAPYFRKCGVIAGLDDGDAQNSVTVLHDIRRATAEMVTAEHSLKQCEIFMPYYAIDTRRQLDFF